MVKMTREEFNAAASAHYEKRVADKVAFSSRVPDPYSSVASSRRAMLEFINGLTRQITDQYPAAEVSAWPSKAEAARAVIAMTARPDQVLLIEDEANLVGTSLLDQAAAIVVKAELFEAIVAKVSGLRQATDAALASATTAEEREVILTDAQTQAISLAQDYGLLP